MITEAYVLAHCMHNSDDVLREVFFPQFQAELDILPPVQVHGHYSPVVSRRTVSFDEWVQVRCEEFRKARYATIQVQLDMRYHDSVEGTTTWLDHVAGVKARYPKTNLPQE